MAMLVITRWQLSNPHKWDEAFLWGLTKNDKHIKQHHSIVSQYQVQKIHKGSWRHLGFDTRSPCFFLAKVNHSYTPAVCRSRFKTLGTTKKKTSRLSGKWFSLFPVHHDEPFPAVFRTDTWADGIPNAIARLFDICNMSSQCRRPLVALPLPCRCIAVVILLPGRRFIAGALLPSFWGARLTEAYRP